MSENGKIHFARLFIAFDIYHVTVGLDYKTLHISKIISEDDMNEDQQQPDFFFFYESVFCLWSLLFRVLLPDDPKLTESSC